MSLKRHVIPVRLQKSIWGIVLTMGICMPLTVIQARETDDREQQRFESIFESQQQKTRTFEAELKQTLYVQGVKKGIVSKGRIFYAAPDRLLIRFHDPEDEFFLLKGDHVVVQKSKEPAIERNLDHGKESLNFAALLQFFQNGAKDLKKTHRIMMESKNSQLIVSLQPKEEESSAPRLTTILRLPELEIASLRIAFSKEEVLLYEFQKTKRNHPLPDHLFTWKSEGETP